MGKDKVNSLLAETHIYDVAAYAGLVDYRNSLSDLQWR